MKRRRMSAKQRRYFGKRRHKTVRAVSVRRGPRRYMARYRRFRSYARKGVGGMKGMIAPLVGGVADHVTDSFFPIQGVGATVTGMFLHNNTVKEIGLYKVGYSIGNFLPLPGGSGGGSGGLL